MSWGFTLVILNTSLTSDVVLGGPKMGLTWKPPIWMLFHIVSEGDKQATKGRKQLVVLRNHEAYEP